MREYGDDTTVDDIESGNQLTLECPCGYKVGPASRLWPASARSIPLAQLRTRLKCERCGQRSPTVVISGFGFMSGEVVERWRWPKA